MEQKFSFALTEEEKQGSLECLQQTHGQMNVMGGVQTRLRVQAQEDVYENTRRSMTQAAQNLKNKWWVNGTTILCYGGLCKPNGKWGFVNVINIFFHFYLLVKASCYSLSFRLLNVVNNSLLIAWDSPLYGGAATFMGTANRKIKNVSVSCLGWVFRFGVAWGICIGRIYCRRHLKCDWQWNVLKTDLLLMILQLQIKEFKTAKRGFVSCD